MSHFQEFILDFFPTQEHISRSSPNGIQPSQIVQPPAVECRQPIATQAHAPVPRIRYKASEMKARERDRALLQQKNSAFRENPRLFQRETMLYVNAIVSGYRMPIFVDTGAEASVMSLKTCKKLRLMNSLDVSEAGYATGVGFSKIHGKLWRVPVQIGRIKFNMQFNILDMAVSVILGLDQMKRLGMNVDLRQGGLRIGNYLVPFTKPPPEDDDTPLAACNATSCVVM